MPFISVKNVWGWCGLAGYINTKLMSPQQEVLSNYLHVRSDLELYSRSLDLKSNDQVMVEIVTKKSQPNL